MTWDAEMPHQTTYDIISAVSANEHTGDGRPTHAWESIRRISGKYFSPMTSTSVHCGRAGSGEACNKDFFAGFDAALARVAKQLHRAKQALRDDQAVCTNQDMVLRAGLGRPPYT